MSRRAPSRARRAVVWAIAGLATSTLLLAACAPPAQPTPTVPSSSAGIGPAASTTTPPSTTTKPPTATTPPPTTSSPVAPAPGAGAAANRIVFWVSCWDVVQLTDSMLDTWRSRGVGGFACMNPYLFGIGGDRQFSGDPSVSLTGSGYDLQRELRGTQIVSRAAARGMTLWLGVDMSNYWSNTAPFGDWFDDSTWSNKVLPQAANLAGAAKLLGFAGVAFDQELYPGSSGSAGSWEWHYPGNTHSEAAVRAKARQRGAQLMSALLGAYPGVDILAIHFMLPEGWSELVQQEINGLSDAYQQMVQIDFWDGMTSVDGYGPIRMMDHVYNKTSHLFQATWDTAFTYDLDRMSAMFSRRLSNWKYASTRIDWGPFAWIDSGPGSFDAARSPSEVAAQLAAFRKWGTGGAFANFAYAGLLGGFNYGPYVAGMQAAAAPGTVDTQPPSATAGAPIRAGSNVTISGSATDNFAVRDVRWSTPSGASGAATMNWKVLGGTYGTGYEWRMDWSASVPAAPGTPITLTIDDVKGLASTLTVTAT